MVDRPKLACVLWPLCSKSKIPSVSFQDMNSHRWVASTASWLTRATFRAVRKALHLRDALGDIRSSNILGHFWTELIFKAIAFGYTYLVSAVFDLVSLCAPYEKRSREGQARH